MKLQESAADEFFVDYYIGVYSRGAIYSAYDIL